MRSARLGSQLKRTAIAPAAFVEVVGGRARARGGRIEIVLAGDVRIRVAGAFDAAVLRRVVVALQRRWMLPTGMRILVCTVPQDMRRSFDTLAQVARLLLRDWTRMSEHDLSVAAKVLNLHFEPPPKKYI